MPLTPKQQRFVAEYLIDLNATQAAIRAGYSSLTAYAQGSRLLSKAEVSAAIAVQQTRALEKAAGSAEWIVQKAVQVVNLAIEKRQLGVAAPNLAILAKRHPEFSEKHDINVNERSQALLMLAELSPEQLQALIQTRKEALDGQSS